jgi:hypothetical protein
MPDISVDKHGESESTGDFYSPSFTKRYYRLKTLDLGDSNIEAVIYPLDMHSLAPSGTPSRYEFGEVIYSQFGIRGQGDREKNLAVSNRRRKRTVRHKIMLMEADRMMTISTRKPIYDPEIFRELLKEFFKRFRAATRKAGHFVCVLEKHDSIKTSEAKRGSLHAHIAVRGRTDYKLLYRIWNSVCARAGTDGAVHVSPSKNSRTGKPYSLRQMANYMTKYLGKTFADVEFNKKAYTCSHGIAAPVKSVALFESYTEAYTAALAHFEARGLLKVASGMITWRNEALDVLWLATG